MDFFPSASLAHLVAYADSFVLKSYQGTGDRQNVLITDVYDVFWMF